MFYNLDLLSFSGGRFALIWDLSNKKSTKALKSGLHSQISSLDISKTCLELQELFPVGPSSLSLSLASTLTNGSVKAHQFQLRFLHRSIRSEIKRASIQRELFTKINLSSISPNSEKSYDVNIPSLNFVEIPEDQAEYNDSTLNVIDRLETITLKEISNSDISSTYQMEVDDNFGLAIGAPHCLDEDNFLEEQQPKQQPEQQPEQQLEKESMIYEAPDKDDIDATIIPPSNITTTKPPINTTPGAPVRSSKSRKYDITVSESEERTKKDLLSPAPFNIDELELSQEIIPSPKKIRKLSKLKIDKNIELDNEKFKNQLIDSSDTLRPHSIINIRQIKHDKRDFFFEPSQIRSKERMPKSFFLFLDECRRGNDIWNFDYEKDALRNESRQPSLLGLSTTSADNTRISTALDKNQEMQSDHSMSLILEVLPPLEMPSPTEQLPIPDVSYTRLPSLSFEEIIKTVDDFYEELKSLERKSFAFKELCPIDATSRKEASLLFSYCLELQKRNLIQMKQIDSWKQIKINVL